MPSFQYRELLATSEVFEKQLATTVEESENRTRQEYKRVYHARVLSRFACEWQCRILLKSQAARILARDSPPNCRGVGSLSIWWRCWGSAAVIRSPLEKVVEIDAGRWRCQRGGPGGCEAD